MTVSFFVIDKDSTGNTKGIYITNEYTRKLKKLKYIKF